MLMIIFGAGASYGSRPFPEQGDESLLGIAAGAGRPMVPRPPLTDGLFSEELGEFAASYPSCRPAIVRLRHAHELRPEAPVEEEIARLYEDARGPRGDPERERHLLALRFYLWDLIQTQTRAWWDMFHGFTYYTDLLDRLGSWRLETNETVALVTFNYDELLDRSAEAQARNWTLDAFSSYVERDDWRL